ncbi:hypothetical protein ACFVT8_08290 [Lysinibacillus sp. NPDC058147]|uniref:hypothetical protein n=1 Tax=unclassified Lysinibacillus TaxID=2636778 RepID=UPI0036DE2EE9
MESFNEKNNKKVTWGSSLKIKLLFSFIFILVLLAGCASDKEFTLNDVKKIKLELIKKETLKEGISYSIKLINDSDYVIKQNNVLVSFPIKRGESGYKENEYKVEADGNKLDIQPGEKVTLNVFMPFEGMGDKTLLGIDNPSIKLKGYMETVDAKHQFTMGGDLIKN